MPSAHQYNGSTVFTWMSGSDGTGLELRPRGELGPRASLALQPCCTCGDRKRSAALLLSAPSLLLFFLENLQFIK